MVDHQIAHVYADEGSRSTPLETRSRGLEGIDAVLDGSGKAERGIDHPNAGDLVLVAEPDAWFQYYWWNDRERAALCDRDGHPRQTRLRPLRAVLWRRGTRLAGPRK